MKIFICLRVFRTIRPYCIDFFQQNGFGIRAIIYKQQDELIGFCGFRFLDDTSEIEILYGITPSYWGMGLATEAVKAVIGYGFKEHHFNCIVGLANIENIRSQRVMELAKNEVRKTYALQQSRCCVLLPNTGSIASR